MRFSMSVIAFVFTLSSFFSCSTSNEDKAENLVESYLKQSLENPKSYESVSWGKLDSVINVLETDEFYISLSFNPEYPDFTIPKDEIYSMSLVVGLLRL